MQKNKFLRDKVYTSITYFHSIQKDQYHHPQKENHIMVIVDALTHYVVLNSVPHCNAYYAFTTLYEHWIAKFGLPEILVTDNGTDIINNEIITLCHLYIIKHKPFTSHAPWTNGLVEGMNRSL